MFPIRYLFTGKERDTESGNDYFGYRYYASSMGRWTSPDPSGLQYADPTNPQSLNLYAYVENNPLGSVDADGHSMSYIVDGAELNDEEYYPSIRAAVQSYSSYGSLFPVQQQEDPEAQQQSSNGGGFWSGLKHGFSNLFHGHSWGYIKATVSAEDVGPHVPVPALTGLTDAAGLISTATKNTPLGVASAVGSVVNDHSAQNVTTNAVGLIPGLGWQTGIMGAFIDFFDYGINNSNPGPKKVGGDPTGPGSCNPRFPRRMAGV